MINSRHCKKIIKQLKRNHLHYVLFLFIHCVTTSVDFWIQHEKWNIEQQHCTTKYIRFPISKDIDHACRKLQTYILQTENIFWPWFSSWQSIVFANLIRKSGLWWLRGQQCQAGWDCTRSKNINTMRLTK